MSSNFSLVIVNLFVGLCRGSRGLPDALRRLGYEDKWIERQFFNQDREPFHPELILASPTQDHALLIEAKSGANTDEDQLRRYARVSSVDLRERAFLRERESGSHDVSIIGRRQHVDRLRIGLEAGDWGFPLLIADDDGLGLEMNDFASDDLSIVFRSVLEIDWDSIPLGWLPFDHGSDLWEVAEVVMPELLGRMVKREPRVTARSVCQARSSWDIIGRDERRQMEEKVRQVFAEAAGREFSDYFRLAGNALVVVQNPVELDAARSTVGLQRLRRLQGEFLHRLRAEGDQLEFRI